MSRWFLVSSCCLPAGHAATLLVTALTLLLLLLLQSRHHIPPPVVVVVVARRKRCSRGRSRLSDTREIVAAPDERRWTRTDVRKAGLVAVDVGVFVERVRVVELSLRERFRRARVLQRRLCNVPHTETRHREAKRYTSRADGGLQMVRVQPPSECY